MTVSLRDRLEGLHHQLSFFPEPREPPPTILQVIGRGHKEQDWRRLLFHYLSPNEAHGLNHELLKKLLIALSDRDDVAYSYSQSDLEDVQISQEVPTPQGRVDAVLWSPQEWFICWELKVTSGEQDGQTIGYVEAESFSRVNFEKNSDETESTYLYLAPDDAPPPEASEFTAISWDWIRSIFQSFLTECHGEYPARTLAQLQDFIGTIRTELTMTEYQENQRDKAKLYVEYFDEITEIETAFDDQWKKLKDRWGTRLAQVLNNAVVVEDSEAPDQFVVVDVTGSDTDRQRWLLRQSKDWASLRRQKWWRSTPDLSTIYSVPEDESVAGLSLVHRLKKNRDLAVKDRTLELEFWHKNENSDEFVSKFNQCLMDKEEEIKAELPPAVKPFDITENKRTLWRARYDIHLEDYDDFFDAYIGALGYAFEDLVKEHPKLLTSIDEAYDEALSIYR